MVRNLSRRIFDLYYITFLYTFLYECVRMYTNIKRILKELEEY